MSGVAHHVLLGLAAAALVGAGFRLASLAAPTGVERTIAAIVIAAALAIFEALALGAFGAGTKALPLGVVAGLTWVTATLLAPAPDVAPGAELAGAWRRLGTRTHVAVLVLGGIALAWTVWLLRHPSIGLDSSLYHYLEVSRWLHDGHTGGFERLDYGLSYSSYPLSNEVLLAWGAGIARSFAPLAVWTPLMLVLAGVASWHALRTLDVPLVATVLAVAAVVTLPLAIRQLNEPSTDVPALAWLACAGALCAHVPRRPALLAPALLAAGLALGSKTTTLVPLAFMLAIAIYLTRDRLRAIALPLALALVAAVAVGGIWFVRGIILYGSPLWPHVSAPWGAPKPHIFSLVGERFLARPAATIDHRAGAYLARLAGGIVLAVAALLSPLAGVRSATWRSSRAGRATAIAALVAGLALLAWGLAPVTGTPRAHGLDRPGFLALSGLRYALPALLAAAAAIALAARAGARAGQLAIAVLAAATVWNVIADSRLGPPYTPSLLVLAAGAALGVALAGGGLVAGRLLPRHLPQPLRGAGGGGLLAALAGLALVPAASGYVRRSGDLAQSTVLGRQVVAWFASQPGFAHGHRPIAFASRAPIAALAGPRFNHPLSVVPPFERCVLVRERARRGWVVVTDPGYGYGFLSTDPYTAGRCLDGRPPRYDDGTFRVYAIR